MIVPGWQSCAWGFIFVLFFVLLLVLCKAMCEVGVL